MIKRALIVQKPYAGLIVDGLKTMEMRSRPTNIRERVGIIEAKSGLIIGEVGIVGCTVLSIFDLVLKTNQHRVKSIMLLERWPVSWMLKNACRYAWPIKYKHPPGAQMWVRV